MFSVVRFMVGPYRISGEGDEREGKLGGCWEAERTHDERDDKGDHTHDLKRDTDSFGPAWMVRVWDSDFHVKAFLRCDEEFGNGSTFRRVGGEIPPHLHCLNRKIFIQFANGWGIAV